MKYLLTLMAVCLVFASCSKNKNEEPDPIETQARRTVIVYISADNNLSGYVAGDFQQMLKGSASMPSDGNLILYIDRKGQTPCIVSIKNEKADTISVATENTYASDPTVMIDVMSSIMDEYPADDYGLVLWGHANGWIIEEDSIATTQTKTRSIKPSTYDTPIRKAYGIDNGYWMNIPTLANVLGTLPNKFKYIFADCCCFQSVENAYELRNVTDYIIGSPAEIPAVGAPYNTVVPALFDYTDTFYKSIVDAYAAQVVGSCYEPLSVIKTSEMENLAQATAPLLQVLAEKGGVDQDDAIAYYFSDDEDYPAFYKLLYDMQDLFMNYVDDASPYANWKTALDQAVIYKHMAYPWITNNYVYFNFTLSDANYGGVSIFIPATYYPSIYNIGIKKMAWYYATGMDDYFSNVE